MRIYTNIGNEAVFHVAAKGLPVWVHVSQHGSRKRAHRYDVNLEAKEEFGRRRCNMRDGYAATWDEWGTFLARIFALDPEAICGQYDGAEAFAWQTGEVYGDGSTHVPRCLTHRWVSVPDRVERQTTQVCANTCGVKRRWKW